MNLTLETKTEIAPNPPIIAPGGGTVLITPPLDEDFWLARVRVSDKQSLVAFPKFMTIGIGFQIEDEDWNTNLPYTSDALEIYEHIARNKGDDSISTDECINAIRLLQAWAQGYCVGTSAY